MAWDWKTNGAVLSILHIGKYEMSRALMPLEMLMDQLIYHTGV